MGQRRYSVAVIFSFKIVLSEFGKLDRELGLKLDVPKHPKRPPYIDKLRRVRNSTVVHWGGSEKKHQLDSQAGRRWGFSWPGDATDLRNLAFGSQSVIGAQDRGLQPIPATHEVCMKYLKQYDDKCVDLFRGIASHLPITLGTRQYVLGRQGAHSE